MHIFVPFSSCPRHHSSSPLSLHKTTRVVRILCGPLKKKEIKKKNTSTHSDSSTRYWSEQIFFHVPSWGSKLDLFKGFGRKIPFLHPSGHQQQRWIENNKPTVVVQCLPRDKNRSERAHPPLQISPFSLLNPFSFSKSATFFWGSPVLHRVCHPLFQREQSCQSGDTFPGCSYVFHHYLLHRAVGEPLQVNPHEQRVALKAPNEPWFYNLG